MAEPNKMLEETANYLLNHCFVLGGVEDQRAKIPLCAGSSARGAGRVRAAGLCGNALPGSAAGCGAGQRA